MLQTPRFAFRDPALRDCTVEKDALGQPKARSGNFATVFRGYRADGGEFAIRVFNRQGDQRRERYQELQNFLDDRAVSSLVRFEYDEKGIRSGSDGKLYPLLTMEWVPGVTLFEWVRDRCHERYQEALKIGAEVWLQLVRELAAADVVHGDLQHANVMVSREGHFKLVDYDCMAVPSLFNRPNLEIGMEPYQHPGRNEQTVLTPGLDNFSSLVIYVALRALAAAPHLWFTYVEQVGYDKLLFKKEDFQNPGQSHLYYELMNSPDEQVRDLTHYLFQLLQYDLYKIPPIDEVLLWCNSLDQLLAAKDWDTAVQLVRRMSPSEQIDPQLQPLVDQAHRRVTARESLEAALASGDEIEVQRCYVPDLLDDYPAAAPLVEQARQAPRVMQALEVLKAALAYQNWTLLRDTWVANEDLLDKRPSAKEIKTKAKVILEADKLRRLLSDTNSDDRQVIESWEFIQEQGGHPLADPLAKVVQGRRMRQQAVDRLIELAQNAPDPPELAYDRQIVEAWKKEFFEGWDRIPKLRQTYRRAVRRVKRLQRLYQLGQECSLEGERELVALYDELPEGYHAEADGRVRRAHLRLKAYEHFRKAVEQRASDDSILAAASGLEQAKGQQMLTAEDRKQISMARKRIQIIERLSQLSNTLPPPEIDRKLLELWEEEALAACKAADPWRQRHRAAKRRADILVEMEEAAKRQDRATIDRLAAESVMADFPLPSEVSERIAELRQEAEKERLLKRQRLTSAINQTDIRSFFGLFDADIVRDICGQFPHHQPMITQWINSEILPRERNGLAVAEDQGIEYVGERHYRASWTWPPANICDCCRLAVFPRQPSANANLDHLDKTFCVTIDRGVWEAGDKSRDILAEEEWEGGYVLVWGLVDTGFQVFNTEPVELGQLEPPKEKKARRWSLFGRKKATEDHTDEQKVDEETADQAAGDAEDENEPETEGERD
jgi:serine/threonine protein kinase